MPEDDHYARLRSSDGVGGDAFRVVLGDPSATRVYVDPSTGRIMEVMDRSRRGYRWLYYGLHTLDFPFLANNAVRTPLMLLLLAGGTAFSVTGIVLGWKRLSRKAGGYRSEAVPQPRH